jgi:hypothetical protein
VRKMARCQRERRIREARVRSLGTVTAHCIVAVVMMACGTGVRQTPSPAPLPPARTACQQAVRDAAIFRQPLTDFPPRDYLDAALMTCGTRDAFESANALYGSLMSGNGVTFVTFYLNRCRDGSAELKQSRFCREYVR